MTLRRQRSRRRLLDLTLLLAVASTSSALNLSQFQIIVSDQIPKRCIRAYQSEIDGCAVKDFSNGNQCSSKCVKGLEETASLIDDACGDLRVTEQSLLGIVLSGRLVNTLCPGLDSVTTTSTARTSSTNGFITLVPPPAPTTTRDRTSTTDKATTTKSTSTATTTTASSSSLSATRQSTTESADRGSPVTSSRTSSPSIDTTSIQNAPQSTVTDQPAQSPPPDNTDQESEPFVGGSPFDPAPIQNRGAYAYSGYGTSAFVGALAAAILMLR
ncbi:hypothetical protein GGS23DRAFT_56504 [Durotheca rogersii]|uniref:uncharacterized protein n=1 Tax=Durotheca rogersii TaxID=419775 RepID=UPI00221ECAA0|nr:uncharacterized protein GGS23DRAFT_56504 [Durotheca rogersii]KAI5863172.1 hypothetical protein GGS23DRAFT_56504 [Durotheca rogersii]